MKQSALIRRLARATGVTPAAAADQLDRIVAQIVDRLRRGHAAKIPGLGAFPPGDRSHFDFAKRAKAQSPAAVPNHSLTLPLPTPQPGPSSANPTKTGKVPQ